jgi:hypothetical protein
MREAVGQLPTEYLRNYTESFEAGIVERYASTSFCVACCLVNDVRRERRLKMPGTISARYGDSLPAVEELERLADGYNSHEGRHRGDGSAYRTALYDMAVEELASRSAPTPATVTNDAVQVGAA